MKRYFILPSILILMMACGGDSSQPESITADFPLDGFEVLEYPGTDAYQATKKDEKGQVSEEGTIQNGKRNGTWYTYHQRTGIVKTASDFINGILNGIHFEFNDRGQVEVKAYFVNGVVDGPRYKYRFGKIIEDAFYANGKLEGNYKQYHNNGKLQQESEFKNGERNGKATYFDDKGVMIMDYIYKDNEIVSGGKVDPPPAE